MPANGRRRPVLPSRHAPGRPGIGARCMLIFRWLTILLLLFSAGCFGLFVATGQQRYKRLGFVVLIWTMLAAFVFFAILIAERVL